MEPVDERAVIEELWKRARPSVASFIASVVPNLDDADDLQQRVAVAVVRKFADFDRSRSFTAWAIGIARFEVLGWRRERANDRHVIDSRAMDDLVAAHGALAEELSELFEALERCLGRVAEESKEILSLRYGHNYTAKKIAKERGLTERAVFARLHRIRVGLKECVERELAG